MRGQAFVVFEDIAHATTAKHALQNFTFHRKPMVIEHIKLFHNLILQGNSIC